VAMPIAWSEVRDPALHPRKYTLRNAGEKLKRDGDVWKGMRKSARSPEKAMKALGISDKS